jgi:SOS-response transcriptional repressor LexA
MSDLTPRQTQILRLIQDCIADSGMPPTRAEIARELGFRSANAAEEHLRALARKGVHRTPDVRSRQIVVARLENEVTVKRYRQEGSVVWLMPENEDFEPIRVDLKEEPLLIEGIVVGVLRQGRAAGLM